MLSDWSSPEDENLKMAEPDLACSMAVAVELELAAMYFLSDDERSSPLA